LNEQNTIEASNYEREGTGGELYLSISRKTFNLLKNEIISERKIDFPRDATLRGSALARIGSGWSRHPGSSTTTSPLSVTTDPHPRGNSELLDNSYLEWIIHG